MGYRITVPLLRVSMGDDVWFTGDGKLRTVSVELGEDDRSNRCNFTLYDKGNEIGAKYFKMSFEKGGIEVPADLLEKPQENAPVAGAAPGTGSPSAGATTNTTLSPNMRAFLDMIAYAEGTDKFHGYGTIFTGKQFTDFSKHPNQVICAGICSSAAGRYQFLTKTWNGLIASQGYTDFSPATQDLGCVALIRQRGAFDEVEAGNIAAAIQLCNKEWASLPGSPYGQPVKTLQELLKVHAEALAKYGAGATPPAAEPAQEVAAASTPPATDGDVAKTKPQEVSKKGTEIVVEMGYEIGQMVGFHFIHTGSNVTALSDRTVAFEGQGIRYLLSRRSQNTSYENISLRELAQIICDRYKLTLDMPGDGPDFIFLDQTGVSDYELLYRECRGIGWKVGENGRSLVLRPVIPNFTGFLIDETLAANFSFSDRASNERIMPPPEGLTAQSVPTSVSEQQKASVDPKSGKVTPKAPEDSTATGTGGVSATGSPNAPVTGTTTDRDNPAAAQAAIEQGRGAEEGAGQNPESEAATTSRQIDQGRGNSLVSANNLDASIGGMTDAIERGRKKEEEEKKKKEGGEDGKTSKSSTQAANYEIARGYESSCTFKTVPAALKLKPGDIIAIAKSVLPVPFAREWRISRITHTAQGGSMTTTLNIYSPIAVQKKESGAAPTTGGGGIVSNAPTGKLQNPMPGALRGTPFDPAGRIRGRPHKGIDLSGGSSDDILCAASGKVSRAVTGCRVGDRKCGGGFGNCVYVDHDGEWTGYSTVYAHLRAVSVTTGAVVTKGQKLGLEGNTGSSGGNHLHFELRQGSSRVDPEPYLVPCPGGVYGQGANYKLRCSTAAAPPQPA